VDDFHPEQTSSTVFLGIVIQIDDSVSLSVQRLSPTIERYFNCWALVEFMFLSKNFIQLWHLQSACNFEMLDDFRNDWSRYSRFSGNV
jgi:hypothetical protein